MNADANLAHRIVQLRFKPLWLYVDGVREFCNFFSRSTFDDAELGERVGIVVHELVENAIRYGDERELELSIERNAGSIVVSVANTTTEDRATRLEAVLSKLTGLDPHEAYARAMMHAATLSETESGLGIPRIRSEARFDVQLERTPGRVCITARGVA